VRNPATSSSSQTISPPLNQTAARDAERLDNPGRANPTSGWTLRWQPA
jgi:hypothetical protein